MTSDEYLHSYETNRRRELVYGRVSEPAAPFFSHQQVALKVARVLADHVESAHLGKIGIAPIDVLLDAERGLIVQPDVFFIAAHRTRIIRNQIWGPPDLVVEVLSLSTASYDRGEKLGWYRQYGVREYWLVDPANSMVTVVDFVASTTTMFSPNDVVRSSVLTEFAVPASLLLA